MLLSPFTPMLFMGEEYGEPAPFPFFVDHGDPELLDAMREGRRREFRGEWTEEVADPGDPATFAGAVLDPSLAGASRTARCSPRTPSCSPCGAATACCAATPSRPSTVARRRRSSSTGAAARAASLLVLGFGAGPATVLRVDAAGLRVALRLRRRRRCGAVARPLPRRPSPSPATGRRSSSTGPGRGRCSLEAEVTDEDDGGERVERPASTASAPVDVGRVVDEHVAPPPGGRSTTSGRPVDRAAARR